MGQAIYPNKHSHLMTRRVAGSWQVLQLTSSFVTLNIEHVGYDGGSTGQEHQFTDWRWMEEMDGRTDDGRM